MNDSNGYESKLWKVLEKGRLADLSQFHRPHFFDEVPLYSRQSDISFLDFPAVQANSILLGFALKFLNSVISYEEHRTPYFAAITVWDFPEDEPLVPNLFVWFDPIQSLYDRLTLDAAKTAWGKKIKRTVSSMRLSDRFDVLEDNETTADSSRVFIGPSLPPYRSFVPLYAFRKPAGVIKR